MRIEILRRTTVTGAVVLPGDVVDVTDRDGRLLIGMGKAQPAMDPICPVVVSDPLVPPTPVRSPRKPRTRKGI